MRDCEKVAGKVAEKSIIKVGDSVVVVNKIIGKPRNEAGKTQVSANWWKNGEKICTKKLFNFIRSCRGFTGFTQTTTTATNSIIKENKKTFRMLFCELLMFWEYQSKVGIRGGLWK